MEYQWLFKNPNPLAIKYYQENGFSDLMSRVLLNRGISVEDYNRIKSGLPGMLEDYLNKMKNLRQAAIFFLDEIKKPNTKILVYADYDADGITSATIAHNMLMMIAESYDIDKNAISIHVPERKEGYGMNMEWCKKIVAAKKADDNYLVITFDNGITKTEEVKYLKNNNISVIITDHHEPEDSIPDCLVVDAKADENRFGEELCGAEVALLFFMSVFNFMDDVETIVGEKLYRELDTSLELAAIGAVADMMPMSVFNLALVTQGLIKINKGEYAPIEALRSCFGLIEVTAKDIGFSIAATINACGQMGNANLAYELFISSRQEEIEVRAKDIFKLYSKNKALTKKLKTEIQALVDEGMFLDHNLCIYLVKGIPNGIAGKLAQSIATATGKPAVVLVDGSKGEEIYGSGRGGDSNINLLEVLQHCMDKGFVKYANGHKAACGVCFYRKHLADIQEEADAYIESLIDRGLIDIHVKKPLYIDKIITINDICEKTYQDIISIPYSMNFANPNLMIDGEIMKTSRSKSNPNNVCYTLRDVNTGKTMNIWAWNLYPNTYNPDIHKELKIVGNLNRNFMSPKNFTLDIIDMKFV